MNNTKERILLYGSNLWYLSEGMLGPLFAVFAQRVGGDVLDIAWAWAAYLMLQGVLVIVIGRISDRLVSKEVLMVLGYALNAVFTFAYLFVSAPVHLFFVQAGLGVATALAIPTWDALYSKYEDKKHAGSAWGRADGQAKIFTALAMLVGGVIVSSYSFTALFVVMGIMQTIATLYQARILRR